MSNQQQSQIDQNHQDTNGNMSNNSSAPNYKTSLCHQWLTNGQCPRAQSCNYAHGTAEIRPRYGEGPAALYKNNLCKFWQSGKCAHGDQCNYAHGMTELRPMPSSTASSLSSLGSHNAFPPAPPLTSTGIGATKDQLPLFHPTAPNAAMFMSFLPPPPCLPPPPPFMSAFPPPPHPQPYLMSNPQPPNGLANPFATPPLWGQPPPPVHPPPQIHSLLPPPIPLPSIAAAFSSMNSSPTSLNSLLKREHFQPLTGGGGTTTNSSSSTSASSKTILQTKNGGNVSASLNGQQQKENNSAGIGGNGGDTNVPLAAANAKGSTPATTKTNPMNMLFSGHRSSPFFADFHRSRSSSIPSNKSPTPNQQPFTMAQIAQQFENANFFGGLSATPPERRAATPDFNTNNDADFPSLNCATKKHAPEEEKGKDEEKQQKLTTLTEVKTQPASTTSPAAAATFEQPQKSFANIAAKTPAAFAAEAARKSTKMATTTVKHSASAGCVVTVQQQQQKYAQQKGGMPTPTTTTKTKKTTAPTPPVAPPLGLVQKAITRPAPKKSTTIGGKTETTTSSTISIQKHANSVPSTPFLHPQISLSSTTNPSPPPSSSLTAATTNEDDDGGGGEYASAIGGLAKNKFDDLFEKDPFLNHARNLEETMFKSIERTTRNTGDEEEEEVEEEEVADRHKVEEDEEVAEAPNEWHTVVSSRHRKSSLNAEYFSHRPSPCTDDGYQEGFSSGEEYNPHQQANQSGASGGRMADSPASISQQSDGANRQQQSSNANGNNGETPRLDKSHIFYRTHICLFWQNNREGKGPPCKHGERCFYAHGEKKLIKLNPIYFKTTLCEAYNNGEQCPYGSACNFAHGEKDMRKPAFNGVDSKKTKFFSVPHRHQLRKQRGMQTVHCIPTIAKPVEKVVVIKTNPWEDNNKK